MKLLPVIDKYTYQNYHQTDYSYSQFNVGESENVIKQRMVYKDGIDLFEGLFPLTICDCGIPKNSFQLKTLFEKLPPISKYSGVRITYTCETNSPLDAYLRIHFKSGDRDFLESIKLRHGTNSAVFTLDVMPFADSIDFTRFQILSVTNNYGIKVVIEEVKTVYILDPFLRYKGQDEFFTVENSTIAHNESGLSFKAGKDAKVLSPELPDTSLTVFDMMMPLRNTFMFVISNNSSADHLILSYKTRKHGDFCTKRMDIIPYSGPVAYYCNVSDTENCDGRLMQFALTAESGEGTITLKRFTFEQEKAIEEKAGAVLSCTSDGETITIKGTLKDEYKDCALALYQTSMADELDTPAGKVLVTRVDGASSFTISKIPFYYKGITRISCQLILFAELNDGRKLKVSDRFYIDNAADFYDDRYRFTLPDYTVSVESFGALGNGFTDDTEAIQAAIDAVSKRGGGKVVIPGDDSLYGRRFIATSILMRSNVELHIEKGAIIWQSQDPKDYTYQPYYGHDGIIEGINWTHALHVCNLPLIQATNVENVKVTGPGKIRSLDIGSEDGIGMPGYASSCPDRIHVCPMGCFNVENLELDNFELVRTNNYHITAYHCKNVRITGIKMHEVKCVSGDGIGVGAADSIYIANVQFQSNDDGVTITSHFDDPRGILWWTLDHDCICATRNLLIEHCYINSGGGKAVAFITWGTTMDYQELCNIRNVEVRDCHLVCVNPVGSWPDNPYAGKMPFDNSDLDDFSPVTTVRILQNRYEGNCKIYPLVITDFVTDCGLTSSSTFMNGDFSKGGFAYWCTEGNVEHYRPKNRREGGKITDGYLYQGLYLEPGIHHLTANMVDDTPCTVIVRDALTGELLLKKDFADKDFALTIETKKSNTWHIGFASKSGATLLTAAISSELDYETINANKIADFETSMKSAFELPSSYETILNETDGKLYFTMEEKDGTEEEILSTKEFDNVSLNSSIRVLDCSCKYGAFKYGLKMQAKDGGVFKFTVKYQENLLELTHEKDGISKLLYRRENFFFTSNDFHSFDVTINDGSVALFIDKGQYMTLNDPRLMNGKIGAFVKYGKIMISGLTVD